MVQSNHILMTPFRPFDIWAPSPAIMKSTESTMAGEVPENPDEPVNPEYPLLPEYPLVPEAPE